MKIRKEQYIKGIIVHFYNRVVSNELLFREKDDYLQFLQLFKKVIRSVPALVYAYCLMPNHFHFLLRQNCEVPLYRIFNKVLSPYVQKFNLKYHRRGSIFAHPLQSKLVTNNKQIITLCMYIHLNPVKAKLVQEPEDWEYSNYSEWVGTRKGVLFDDAILKEYFTNINEYIETIREYKQKICDINLLDLLDESKE